MRNFKFRGRMKLSGKWIYGDIAHLYGDVYIQTDISDNERRGTIGWDVDDSTIGQFTGLHDKNGKEIYEGDIICSYDSQNNPIMHEIYYLENEARFAAKLIGYEFAETGTITKKWINEFDKVVVGNVFDNPELLKK